MANAPVSESDPTIGRLVSDATRDVSTLIRSEIELAKSELRMSAKAGGLGIGLFVAAAFFAMMSLIMLSVAIAYFIHWNGEGLALQWAFTIVFAFYILLAAILIWIGVRKVRKVRAPERAIEQAQETRAILKRG
jgi:uncharacterized membrane protein